MNTADTSERVDGISECQWLQFRYAVKPLSSREKMRPSHWQRKLYDFFAEESTYAGFPENRTLIERVITAMMEGSRTWCNPQIFDEAGARAALRTAFDTILKAQVSTGTDVKSEDDGQLSQPVDVVTRTAELARELGL